MKRTKAEMIESERRMLQIAREEKNRELGVTTLYQVVKILSEGTRFESDCLDLCRQMDALWADTKSEKEARR